MTEVTIQNFQSIKDVSFNIDGFTVIVGKNNLGKSAVIRAIDAALTNQVGNDFIRHGEKNTTVRIKRGDLDIIWNKGDKASYMISTDNGKTKQPFTALNRDIPKPLLDAGFGKMEMGDQKVNPTLASQFDPLFLLNKGGAVVTEVLASLYDLDTLSIADEVCQKSLKSQKSLLKTRDSDLEVCQKDLVKYAGFEDVKANVEKLMIKDQECTRLKTEIEKLKEYEEQLRVLGKSVKSLGRITKVALPDTKDCNAKVAGLSWILEREQAIKTSQNRVSSLSKIKKVADVDISSVQGFMVNVQELSNFERVLNVSKKIVEKLSAITSVDFKAISTLRVKITSIVSGYGELSNLTDQFLSCAITAKDAREAFRTITTAHETRQEEFNKLKVELGVCPYCGSAFK